MPRAALPPRAWSPRRPAPAGQGRSPICATSSGSRACRARRFSRSSPTPPASAPGSRWASRIAGGGLAIVGDIAHSRVARSAIAGLTALGTRVTVCGPGTLMPADVEQLGCEVAPTLEAALAGADAAMALRIQSERMEKGLLPSLGEYARLWGLSPERVELMAPHAVVMHPGPVNRGVELAHEVADGPRSRILAQLANGVAVARPGFTCDADVLPAPHGIA